MDKKKMCEDAAVNLQFVHVLRDYNKGKKGELADMITNAANKIEELTAKIFELSGEVEKYEREKANSTVSNKPLQLKV